MALVLDVHLNCTCKDLKLDCKFFYLYVLDVVVYYLLAVLNVVRKFSEDEKHGTFRRGAYNTGFPFHNLFHILAVVHGLGIVSYYVLVAVHNLVQEMVSRT